MDQRSTNFDVQSRDSFGTRGSARSKAASDVASYVTAIAEPKILNAWSPTKPGAMKRLSGVVRQLDMSPDFRITKNTGV